ncbi:hypothetical protein MKZ38_004494 [Zalerion maritima]|uniref:Uncharacterized protein n=1 Tax=Zalerion maritima TaxID=339359 RepID=A0AAD5RM17_9PEZI|nr:hypothetical protein MKZ38_004494 [Zalerion maritima]
MVDNQDGTATPEPMVAPLGILDPTEMVGSLARPPSVAGDAGATRLSSVSLYNHQELPLTNLKFPAPAPRKPVTAVVCRWNSWFFNACPDSRVMLGLCGFVDPMRAGWCEGERIRDAENITIRQLWLHTMLLAVA